MTVLLVEDNKIDQLVTNKIVGEVLNLDPLVFNNGQEALLWLTEANLSEKIYVLLDIKMPVMGGLEFLQSLMTKFDNLNLVVFMLTSSIDENDYKEAIQYNCVKEFITKPLKPNILQEIMQKH